MRKKFVDSERTLLNGQGQVGMWLYQSTPDLTNRKTSNIGNKQEYFIVFVKTFLFYFRLIMESSVMFISYMRAGLGVKVRRPYYLWPVMANVR